jgi:hypothetical protein
MWHVVTWDIWGNFGGNCVDVWACVGWRFEIDEKSSEMTACKEKFLMCGGVTFHDVRCRDCKEVTPLILTVIHGSDQFPSSVCSSMNEPLISWLPHLREKYKLFLGLLFLMKYARKLDFDVFVVMWNWNMNTCDRTKGFTLLSFWILHMGCI